MSSDREIREASQAIVRRQRAAAVVTSLGSGGAVLVTEGEVVQIRAPTVTIRSKVGAGDSMVGGIVFALTQGKKLDDAVRYGVASGAAAVMTPGSELCRADDVESLYQQML